MSETIQISKTEEKIGFPILPHVPASWQISDTYEQSLSDTLFQIEERYYQDILPYLDKDNNRVRVEELSDEERLWFAGFVDDGTRISFDRNGKYFYPVLSRADVKSPQRALALLRLGGNIQDHTVKNSPDENKPINWRWFTRGRTAVRIADLFADDLIYKRSAYEQISNWRDSPHLDDRNEVALGFTNDCTNHRQNIHDLHPSYIAGLFDSNGLISSSIDRRIHVPNVQMYFNNEELPEYLFNHFGGTHWTKVENKDYSIYDKTFHTDTTQYIWRIQQQPALDFLRYIRPYVWLNSEMIDNLFMMV